MKFNRFVGVSNNVQVIVKMSVIAVALFYFAYHAVSGENGFLSYVKVKKLVVERQLLMDKLATEFSSLERNVKLFSDNNLDLDLLEERCRAILNYSRENEIIVKINESN